MVLNMPGYVGIIPGYAWLCLNVLKSVWMAFVFHVLIVIPCVKEPYVVFLESKNLIFSIVFDFVFCFRLNISTSKFSNLLLPFGAEEAGGCESCPTIEIPSKYYLWCFFSDLFIYFVVVVFSLFGISKELITKAVIL